MIKYLAIYLCEFNVSKKKKKKKEITLHIDDFE